MKKVGALQKSKDRLSKTSSDQRMMEEDESKTKYPNGTKPFTAPMADAELAGAWNAAKEADFTFTIAIPKGSTRVKAMEILHHTSMAYRKRIEAEALQEKVAA